MLYAGFTILQVGNCGMPYLVRLLIFASSSVLAISTPTAQAATSSAGVSDTAHSAIVAAMIAAVALLVNGIATNWIQVWRDDRMRKQQFERDRVEYLKQQEREQAAHDQAVRDAKRERLRAAYLDVLNAASTYDHAVWRLNTLRPGEDRKLRDAVLTEDMRLAQRDLGRSHAILRLDGASAEVLAQFREVSDALVDFIAVYNSNPVTRDGKPTFDVAPYQTRISAGLDKLTTMMRNRLSELGEP